MVHPKAFVCNHGTILPPAPLGILSHPRWQFPLGSSKPQLLQEERPPPFPAGHPFSGAAWLSLPPVLFCILTSSSTYPHCFVGFLEGSDGVNIRSQPVAHGGVVVSGLWSREGLPLLCRVVLGRLMLVIAAWLRWPFWREYSKQQLMNEALAAFTHLILKIAPQIDMVIYR